MLGMNTQGRALYMPCIELVDDQSAGQEQSQDQGQSSDGQGQGQSSGGAGQQGGGGQEKGGGKEGGKKLLELSGGALLGDDRLLGWQDGQWQKGYYWVAGHIKGGSITLDNPLSESNDLLVMDILDSKGKISLAKEQPLTMKIEVEATLNVVEDTRREFANVISGTLADKQKIEDTFSQEVTAQIEKSLSAAQEAGADVFGFGAYLAAHHPKLAASLDWQRYFQDMGFEIHVKGRMKPSAIIN